MNPNAKQDWHTDGILLKRNSVIIHPISSNYAHCLTKDGNFNKTAILNTQKEHAVFNNSEIRLNLQIPLDVNFDYLVKNKNCSHWKFIDSLYCLYQKEVM